MFLAARALNQIPDLIGAMYSHRGVPAFDLPRYLATLSRFRAAFRSQQGDGELSSSDYRYLAEHGLCAEVD